MPIGFTKTDQLIELSKDGDNGKEELTEVELKAALQKKQEVRSKLLKQYRRYYNKNLEDETDLIPGKTFLTERAFRTKKASSGLLGGLGGLFGGAQPPAETIAVETGKFKGIIQVFNNQRKKEREALIVEQFNKVAGLTKTLIEIQMAED
jgi:hypothetical protein